MNVRRLILGLTPFLCVLAGAQALGASAAGAASTRGRILSSAPFSQPSTFSRPTGVAVDQETGNVYVVDDAAGAVDIFGAERSFAPFAGPPSCRPCGEHHTTTAPKRILWEDERSGAAMYDMKEVS
jgi:hypothetical protein